MQYLNSFSIIIFVLNTLCSPLHYSVTKESIVDVEAKVSKVSKKIESCSQKDVELHIQQLWIVSSAKSQLPLLIEDASRSEKKEEEVSLMPLI